MNVELKLLSLALISIDKSSLNLGQVQHWVSHYHKHEKMPLIPVYRYGRFARYRLKNGSEIVAAAETLQLEALWALVLPNQHQPFHWPGEYSLASVPADEQSAFSQESQAKLDQAKAFLQAQVQGLSQQAIARQFQVSRSYVNNLLQLAKLPEEVKEAFISGRISSSQARILSYEKTPERLKHLLRWLEKESVSARALERAVYRQSDIRMEKMALEHLSRRLSEHWQSPTQLLLSGYGVKVTVRPHAAQIAVLLEAVRAVPEIHDLNWSKKGSSECAQLSFVIPSQHAFSVWVHAIGLADEWDDLSPVLIQDKQESLTESD